MSDILKTYSEEQLPILIERLKSMVHKNMDLINATILGDITEEKYYNVLRGRKMAVENTIWGVKEVVELETVLDENIESNYYKETLPDLIEKIKGMVDENMKIVDTDIDDSITEDKNLNILKARKTASEDIRWAISKVDTLEKELNGVEEEIKKKESWAKRAARIKN